MPTENKCAPACHAPEITQADLDNYTALVAAIPDDQRRLRDTMNMLLKPVKRWFVLPVSTRTDTRTLETVTSGGKYEITEIPLEQSQIEELWDDVPYAEELRPLEPFLDTVQAAAAADNAENMRRWRGDVFAALLAEAFPNVQPDTFWQRRALRNQLLKTLTQDPVMAQNASAAVAVATGRTAEDWDAEDSALATVQQQANAVYAGTQAAPIPKPILADTALRDAAHQLYWYVFELTMDREPLEMTKLRPKA